MPQARQDHFEWGFDNPSVSSVFRYYKFTRGRLVSKASQHHFERVFDDSSVSYSFTTSFTIRGRLESQARQDHFEWGFDNPSVSCVFLYCKFYYKGTICVPGKPRLL